MRALFKGQKFRILGLFFSVYFPKFLSKCYSYSHKGFFITDLMFPPIYILFHRLIWLFTSKGKKSLCN